MTGTVAVQHLLRRSVPPRDGRKWLPAASRCCWMSTSRQPDDEEKSAIFQRTARALGGDNAPEKGAAAKNPRTSRPFVAPAMPPAPPSPNTIAEEVYLNGAEAATASQPPPPPPPQALHQFAPRIMVVGVGGAGGNAVNNMVVRNLSGVDFVALNTDAQHLSASLTDKRLQIGTSLTSGLGCGANPDAGRLAAEESREEITALLKDAHMVFITAGMGGGTGTGAAPVVAEVCYNLGILTVAVVTTPFRFEGTHRMRLAQEGISILRDVVDTLIVLPNQNLFHLVDKKTSFVKSFELADDVLLAGVKSITDVMTSPGLINLDFADVQSVMHGMGNAILGTGQATDSTSLAESETGANEKTEDATKKQKKAEPEEEENDRAVRAALMALENPLLVGNKLDISTAKGMLVNITGGDDMTLYEVDRAADVITSRITDPHANIIFGSAYDNSLEGCIRVSVVATGIEEVQDAAAAAGNGAGQGR